MKDRTNPSLPATAGCSWRGLHVGQLVRVVHGALEGMTRVLKGFGSNQDCLIELDLVQRGVVLIVALAAVAPRPGAFDESTPLAPNTSD